MGQYRRLGTEIDDFWPDDTDTEMYLSSNAYVTMADMLGKARIKWPDAKLD